MVDPEEIRSWRRNAEFEADWLRVLADDEHVVGYGDIWPQGDVLWLDVAAPRHWDAFFEWGETEARTRGIDCVRVQVPHGHPLAAVAEARGYRSRRYAFTMEIALDEPPPAAAFPPGIEARPYREEDLDALLEALNEAFADTPSWHDVTAAGFREFYVAARGFDPSLWLLAWDGDGLAGFALDYPEQGSDTRLGWVNTLGVRPAWRRRGLGEALLRASFGALHARGLRRAGLAVDAQNATDALRLYERVGMRQVRRADTWQKDL